MDEFTKQAFVPLSAFLSRSRATAVRVVSLTNFEVGADMLVKKGAICRRGSPLAMAPSLNGISDSASDPKVILIALYRRPVVSLRPLQFLHASSLPLALLQQHHLAGSFFDSLAAALRRKPLCTNVTHLALLFISTILEKTLTNTMAYRSLRNSSRPCSPYNGIPLGIKPNASPESKDQRRPPGTRQYSSGNFESMRRTDISRNPDPERHWTWDGWLWTCPWELENTDSQRILARSRVGKNELQLQQRW